jgi:peptidoglycan/LPS O-acetylase OafA/YrhL
VYMKKLDYITVLRAVAILLVLTVHVSEIGTGLRFIHPYLQGMFTNGARGVQLFYLLSAFTLFLSFNNRHPNEKKPIRNYFIRRFFRIAPLFYLAIAYYLWQDTRVVSPVNIASHYLFLNGFSPYLINNIVPGGWSIAVEASFYCLLPFLFYRIKNIQQACIFTLGTLCLRFVLFVLLNRYLSISDQHLWNDYLFFYLPNQLPIFGLGIVLYFTIYGQGDTSFTFKFLAIASLILTVGLSFQPGIFVPEIFYFGVIFLLFAYSLHRYHPTILFNSPVLYIGQISYTLYLTHFAAIHFLSKYNLINLIPADGEMGAICNFFLNYGIVVLLSVCLSTILYYTIELPMQNFGRKVIKFSFVKHS